LRKRHAPRGPASRAGRFGALQPGNSSGAAMSHLAPTPTRQNARPAPFSTSPNRVGRPGRGGGRYGQAFAADGSGGSKVAVRNLGAARGLGRVFRTKALLAEPCRYACGASHRAMLTGRPAEQVFSGNKGIGPHVRGPVNVQAVFFAPSCWAKETRGRQGSGRGTEPSGGGGVLLMSSHSFAVCLGVGGPRGRRGARGGRPCPATPAQSAGRNLGAGVGFARPFALERKNKTGPLMSPVPTAVAAGAKSAFAAAPQGPASPAASAQHRPPRGNWGQVLTERLFRDGPGKPSRARGRMAKKNFQLGIVQAPPEEIVSNGPGFQLKPEGSVQKNGFLQGGGGGTLPARPVFPAGASCPPSPADVAHRRGPAPSSAGRRGPPEKTPGPVRGDTQRLVRPGTIQGRRWPPAGILEDMVAGADLPSSLARFNP